MLKKLQDWTWQTIVDWLNDIPTKNQNPQMFNNFSQLLKALQPADVILFEGRARVSDVIKIITLSPWTHAALYIGSLNEITDPTTRKLVTKHYQGDADKPLIIESLLGEGTIVTPLSDYYEDNLRVCRPIGLGAKDQNKVVQFAAEHIGMNYHVRQLLDLARFMFPYGVLPREWRSSLFQHNAGRPTNVICSSMIARCFQSINYPISPIITSDNNDRVKFHKRNFLLFVPSDFDYSPSFQILKFPTWPLSEEGEFHNLPWEENIDNSTSSEKSHRNNTAQIPSLSTIIKRTQTLNKKLQKKFMNTH